MYPPIAEDDESKPHYSVSRTLTQTDPDGKTERDRSTGGGSPLILFDAIRHVDWEPLHGSKRGQSHPHASNGYHTGRGGRKC